MAGRRWLANGSCGRRMTLVPTAELLTVGGGAGLAGSVYLLAGTGALAVLLLLLLLGNAEQAEAWPHRVVLTSPPLVFCSSVVTAASSSAWPPAESTLSTLMASRRTSATGLELELLPASSGMPTPNGGEGLDYSTHAQCS